MTKNNHSHMCHLKPSHVPCGLHIGVFAGHLQAIHLPTKPQLVPRASGEKPSLPSGWTIIFILHWWAVGTVCRTTFNIWYHF